MTDSTEQTVERPAEWAIVELFGHSQIAGMCSQVDRFGTQLLRVDVPANGSQPAFTRYFGGGAIYAYTPVSENYARQAVVLFRPAPPFQGSLALSCDRDNDEMPY